METYDFQGSFYKSLMAGLFTGLIATLANLIFNFFYRDITAFSLSMIINATSIIFLSTILLTVAGILYYLLVLYMHKNRAVYIAAFTAVTAICVFLATQTHRTASHLLNVEFSGLLLGIVLITGLLGAFMVPYLVRHKNMFF